MALLLNIETTTPTGSVCLSQNGKVIAEKISTDQKDHAAAIVPFVREMMRETGIDPRQIEAIAISGGPGSYTGLRVATSTAKGLCYAWNIPLIAISTLKMMANGIRMEEGSRMSENERSGMLICPMIDARRMEIFTALYDWQLHESIAPEAVILKEDFLAEFKDNSIIIAGTGQPKAEKLLEKNTHWNFVPFISKASHLISLAEHAFEQKQFADTAYFDPFYLKSVYLPKKK